jgi:multidrug efflux system outer membrane protein
MRNNPRGFALRASSATLLVCVLAACAVGPDYEPPKTIGAQAVVDAQFANAGESGFAAADVQTRFWDAFNDATLNQLIDDGLAQNFDLQHAVANLRAARGALKLKGFDQFPTVTSSASYTHGLVSATQAPLPGLSRDDREGNIADVGFDASWEIDLFGRVRRDVEAARADDAAAQATVQDAQVSVTAEIARNYFVLRGLQDQLAVASGNADNQKQTVDITHSRLEAGRGNELDTSRAEAQLQTTLASIPLLQGSIATTIYRLSVLTGRPPNALYAQLSAAQPMPALPALNNIGTPEALLRRRPDIRAAERRLAGATARIGVAVGDLFPKVTFVGSIGYNAGSLSDIGDSASERYGFGPSISWAGFDLGRVRSRIDIAKANTDAAFAAYQSTVLGALEETEGALIVYGRAQNRRDTLTLAANASARAASLARQRFEGGLTDFVNVLEAERDALVAQDALSQSRTQTATSLIAVYKALGGGWQQEVASNP